MSTNHAAPSILAPLLRPLTGFFALSLVALITLPAPAADASQASAFVEDLGARAISMLADKTISENERESKFRDLLSKSFAVSAIGRFVLGRYWRAASASEQREYQDLFQDLIVKTYSARLGQYSGEKFKVTGARADGDKGTIVDSNILRDPQPAVRVQWRVRQRDGHLKIVDVVVEGVSMAVTQRSEFASVIRKRGGQVSGLIEDLRAKLTTLEH